MAVPTIATSAVAFDIRARPVTMRGQARSEMYCTRGAPMRPRRVSNFPTLSISVRIGLNNDGRELKEANHRIWASINSEQANIRLETVVRHQERIGAKAQETRDIREREVFGRTLTWKAFPARINTIISSFASWGGFSLAR